MKTTCKIYEDIFKFWGERGQLKGISHKLNEGGEAANEGVAISNSRIKMVCNKGHWFGNDTNDEAAALKKKIPTFHNFLSY